MMPFSSSTNMNRSNFGQQGFGNFYNQQVYKPIRGGGANPSGQPQPVNFGEFMEQQNHHAYSSTKSRPDNFMSQTNLNQNNRFRSLSKNHQLVSKKDMKK